MQGEEEREEKGPGGDEGMSYVRVRGDIRLPCKSLMSKNTEHPNRRQVRHAKAVARLYPSHLSKDLRRVSEREKKVTLPPLKSSWWTPLSRKDNNKLCAPQSEEHHIHRHSPLQPPPRLLPPRLQCQTCKDTSPLRCSLPSSVAPTGSPAISTQPT